MPQELCFPSIGNLGESSWGLQSRGGDKEQRCRDPVFIFLFALWLAGRQLLAVSLPALSCIWAHSSSSSSYKNISPVGLGPHLYISFNLNDSFKVILSSNTVTLRRLGFQHMNCNCGRGQGGLGVAYIIPAITDSIEEVERKVET